MVDEYHCHTLYPLYTLFLHTAHGIYMFSIILTLKLPAGPELHSALISFTVCTQ